MVEKIQSGRIICEGGLNTNQNYLDLATNSPGSATVLINYEPSIYGGYRRINGTGPLEAFSPFIDPTNAEGKTLGVFIYKGDILAARKQKSGATYKFYVWVPGGNWLPITTGFTHVSTGVDKIRYDTFNFNGKEQIIFVDGVNKATVFDGTAWYQIDPAATGADEAHAGGNQALSKPKYVTVFQNHIFISGDSSFKHLVAHSAPQKAYDWTAASGGGQIIAGFNVVQIRPFRNSNYVFGERKIKKIDVNGTAFVINDVATNIGCIASDSVVEIGGNLLFLAPDGFRPVEGTAKIGDVELETVSKNIQQDILALTAQFSSDNIDSVIIRRKSQVRFFFGADGPEGSAAYGIVGGLRGTSEGITWEWGRLQGIKVTCTDSGYIGVDEYVIHGTYDGRVMRQEIGNSFDGEAIYSQYRTPWLDLSDTEVRKTIRYLNIFVRPEGAMTLNTRVKYDWNLPDQGNQNPPAYITTSTGLTGVYGDAIYGDAIWGGGTIPVMVSPIEGSGRSVEFAFTTNDISAPFTIQGFVLEMTTNGRI